MNGARERRRERKAENLVEIREQLARESEKDLRADDGFKLSTRTALL